MPSLNPGLQEAKISQPSLHKEGSCANCLSWLKMASHTSFLVTPSLPQLSHSLISPCDYHLEGLDSKDIQISSKSKRTPDSTRILPKVSSAYTETNK